MSFSNFASDKLSLETFVQESLNKKEERIFSLIWQGQKIWIKRAIPSKKKFIHTLQSVLSACFNWYTPIFRPTFCMGGQNAISQEIYRLETLAKAGTRVPIILGRGENWICLTDAGLPVSFLLESNLTSTSLRKNLILMAAKAMIDVHSKGYCLGSGRLKDMVYDGTHISFIDCEEDPSTVMPLNVAQARDIIFFLLTCVRHYSTKEQKIIEYFDFIKENENRLIMNQVYKLKPFFFPLLLLRLLPKNWLGRDLREACIFAHTLCSAITSKDILTLSKSSKKKS